VYVSCKAQAS